MPNVSIAERCATMNICRVIPVLVWTACVVASAWWNVSQQSENALELATESARQKFQMIELMRGWNADHGGVYTWVTPGNEPNPYLNDPARDLVTQEGGKLTKLNPAYMTRQISELAQQTQVSFHLTSLRPLNPKNKADAWEALALKQFETGLREKSEWVVTDGRRTLRYIAPLFTKTPCLACHAVQGYQLGEIRGGLSITQDANHLHDALISENTRILLVHFAAWLLAAFFLQISIDSNRKYVRALRDIHSAQVATIEEQRDDLVRANREIEILASWDRRNGLHSRAHLHRMMESIWGVHARNGVALSLMLVEIDRFSEYRGRFGAVEGEAIIRQVGLIVRRSADVLDAIGARYDGATFIVLIPDAEAPAVAAAADDVLHAVRSLQIEHGEVQDDILEVRIGIATITPSLRVSPASLPQAAERALKDARKEGGKPIHISLVGEQS